MAFDINVIQRKIGQMFLDMEKKVPHRKMPGFIKEKGDGLKRSLYQHIKRTSIGEREAVHTYQYRRLSMQHGVASDQLKFRDLRDSSRSRNTLTHVASLLLGLGMPF